MTELWEQNRPFAVAIIVWGAGSVLFFLGVHLPFSAPVAALERGTTEVPARSELEKHYAAPGRPAAGVAFADAEKEARSGGKQGMPPGREQLDAALTDARSLVDFRRGPEFNVDPKAAQRAYEYTRVRDRVAAELRELANVANLAVPQELDPRADSKELPKESETDELLVRLAMTDRVVRNAASAKVGRLLSLRHDLGAPRGAPLTERIVRVKLEGGLDSLVRFTQACSTPPKKEDPHAEKDSPARDQGGGILVLRYVDLATAGSGATIVADMTLAALTFTEVKPARKPPPGDRHVSPARRGF